MCLDLCESFPIRTGCSPGKCWECYDESTCNAQTGCNYDTMMSYCTQTSSGNCKTRPACTVDSDCLPQTVYGMTREQYCDGSVCQDKQYNGASCDRSQCDSNNCENGQCNQPPVIHSARLHKQATCDGSVGGCKWNAHKQNCGQCLEMLIVKRSVLLKIQPMGLQMQNQD